MMPDGPHTPRASPEVTVVKHMVYVDLGTLLQESGIKKMAEDDQFQCNH